MSRLHSPVMKRIHVPPCWHSNAAGKRFCCCLQVGRNIIHGSDSVENGERETGEVTAEPSELLPGPAQGAANSIIHYSVSQSVSQSHSCIHTSLPACMSC
jgi:hypothetical protein